jgi:hypothetical protein
MDLSVLGFALLIAELGERELARLQIAGQCMTRSFAGLNPARNSGDLSLGGGTRGTAFPPSALMFELAVADDRARRASLTQG